jgi:hypothetical protein
MEYGNNCKGVSMGANAGKGNRGTAAHVKNLHAAARLSGSVSSMTKPSRGHAAPGASESVLKKPRATSRPIGR